MRKTNKRKVSANLKKSVVKKTTTENLRKSADMPDTKAKTQEKSTSKKKTSKKSDNDIIQIHVFDIKLAKDSRNRLSKVKNALWGTVANAIEWGNWYITAKNNLYSNIKKRLEDGMRKVFSIGKDIPVEIERFMSNIIKYDNHH